MTEYPDPYGDDGEPEGSYPVINPIVPMVTGIVCALVLIGAGLIVAAILTHF